MIVGTPLV